MKLLVFLLEERSMKIVLDNVLRQILPKDLHFITIQHEGKSDLQKSIPKKLSSWRQEGVQFIILHDKDSWDCKELKKMIFNLCNQSGRSDSLIRKYLVQN